MNRIGKRSYRRVFDRGWVLLSAIDLLITVFVLLAVYRNHGLAAAAAWSAKVAVLLLYQQLFMLRNRRRILSGENLDHLWGTANLITLFRGTLIALLAGFVLTSKPPGLLAWLPAVLYTLLAGLDYVDGYWARKTGTGTRLGELLDQEYDGLGILIAVILVVQWGHLPALFLYIGLAKYAFDGASAWRRSRNRPVHPLPPSTMRRRLAGFQMGVLAVFLWPIARMPGTLLAELIVGVPLALGFVRDWLITSGATDPEDPNYLRIRRGVFRITTTYVPLAARVALVAAGGLMIMHALRFPAAAASWLPASTGTSVLLTGIHSALILLFVLVLASGQIPSVSALLLLLLCALPVFLRGLQFWTAVMVSSALLVYLFGPGPYRLRMRAKAARTGDPASG